MLVVRTIALWVCGLLASASIGGAIGAIVTTYAHSRSDGFLGMFGGMFTFACLRLWLTEPRER